MFGALTTLVSTATSDPDPGSTAAGETPSAGPRLEDVGEAETLSDCVTEHGLNDKLPNEWTAQLAYDQAKATDFAEVIIVSHYTLPHSFRLRPAEMTDPLGETTVKHRSNSSTAFTEFAEADSLKEAFRAVVDRAGELSKEFESRSQRQVSGSQYQHFASRHSPDTSQA
jgi:hypothetical protein